MFNTLCCSKPQVGIASHNVGMGREVRRVCPSFEIEQEHEKLRVGYIVHFKC